MKCDDFFGNFLKSSLDHVTWDLFIIKKKSKMANFRHKRNHWLGVDFLFFFKKLTFDKKKKRKEYSTPSTPTYTYYHSTVGFGGGGISAWFCLLGGSFFQFCLIENLANFSPKIAKFMEFLNCKKKISNFLI